MVQAAIKTDMKNGDSVLISPDLTGLPDWEKGIVIDIKNNTFRGIIITAETPNRYIFWGTTDLFKATSNN